MGAVFRARVIIESFFYGNFFVRFSRVLESVSLWNYVFGFICLDYTLHVIIVNKC